MTTTTLPFSWMDEEGLYYTPNGYVHWLYSQKYRLGLSTAWQCLLVLQNHHFLNFDKKYFLWLQPHYLFHGWMRKVYTIHPMAMYIGCTVKNIDLGCQQHDSACMWPKIIIPKNSIIFNFYDYNHITFSMDGWGRSILYTQWLCTLVVQSKISTWVVNSMTMHAWEQKSSLVICHIFWFLWLQPHYLFHGWMRKVYTIHPMAMYIGCTVKNIDLGCQQHDSAC